MKVLDKIMEMKVDKLVELTGNVAETYIPTNKYTAILNGSDLEKLENIYKNWIHSQGLEMKQPEDWTIDELSPEQYDYIEAYIIFFNQISYFD